MHSKAVAIGLSCCSPFRAFWGLPMAFCKVLGRLVWSKRFGQPLLFGAGSWRQNEAPATPTERIALIAGFREVKIST
jgi:hypothetical protein